MVGNMVQRALSNIHYVSIKAIKSGKAG